MVQGNSVEVQPDQATKSYVVKAREVAVTSTLLSLHERRVRGTVPPTTYNTVSQTPQAYASFIELHFRSKHQ